MSTYTTFLLDLDHTLLDSHASEAAAFEATMHSIGIDDHRRHFAAYVEINTALWKGVERGEVSPDEVAVRRFEQLIDREGFDADAVAMADTFRHGLGANGDLYDGALEVLETLAADATLAMITNGIGSVQRARIERLDLARYFSAVVISGEVGMAKPGRGIFDIAFEQLGHPDLDTCVMVGDSLTSDIRGGANAGVATCWYNPHHSPATDDAPITHRIHSLHQLTLPLEPKLRN